LNARLLGVFFNSNMEKLCLKIVSVQVIPPKAANIKTINEGSQNITVEIVGRLGLLHGTC
jgi:hypothetical protein